MNVLLLIKAILLAVVLKKIIRNRPFHLQRYNQGGVDSKLAVIPADNTRFEFYDAHTPLMLCTLSRMGARRRQLSHNFILKFGLNV